MDMLAFMVIWLLQPFQLLCILYIWPPLIKHNTNMLK